MLMLPPEFLSLSAEEGATLGFAIVGCWVAAWGIRALISVIPKHIRDDD